VHALQGWSGLPNPVAQAETFEVGPRSARPTLTWTARERAPMASVRLNSYPPTPRWRRSATRSASMRLSELLAALTQALPWRESAFQAKSKRRAYTVWVTAVAPSLCASPDRRPLGCYIGVAVRPPRKSVGEGKMALETTIRRTSGLDSRSSLGRSPRSCRSSCCALRTQLLFPNPRGGVCS
jgi:hypothetical protein